MDRWLLSFFLGSILALLPPVVPALFYESLLCIVTFLWIYFKSQRVLLAFAFGVLWMLYYGISYQNIWQQNHLEQISFFGKQHRATLIVKGLPKKTTVGWQFIAQINAIENKRLKKPIKVRLNWQVKEVFLANNTELTATLKLKPAYGLANEGGFSYQRWLRSQNIAATGYIVSNAKTIIKPNILSVRAKLYKQFIRLTERFEHQSLMQALTFGNKNGFELQTWQVLQSTGTQHLVAISGLHIGLLVSFSYLFSYGLLRLIPSRVFGRVIPDFNWVYIAVGVAILSATAYSYLAGFAIPTIRALIFLFIFAICQLLGNKLSPSRLVLLAACVTILVMPSSLYSTSFWLSYLAVCAVMLIYWRFKHCFTGYQGVHRYVRILITLQVGLSILLAPVTAYVFNQYAAAALVANLIALPIMSLLVMPLIFLGLMSMLVFEPLAKIFFTLAHLCIELLWKVLTSLASLSWSVFELSGMQVYMVIGLSGLLIGCLIFNVGIKLKKIKTVLATVVSLMTLTGFLSQTTSNWKVTTLDVGQGLAVVIEKNNRALIYDTGNTYPSGWNMSESVVIPYIDYRGLNPDWLVISHDDSDHASGLPQLLTAYPDIGLIFNKRVDKVAKRAHKACIAGQQFIWQGLTVEMLWPKQQVFEENDDSCVLRISDGQSSVLLTGDIAKRVERKLLAKYPNITSDVILAPHHGSKSSSSKAFITAINPTNAIFSAGFLNQWRMPNSAVVARYQAQGSQTLNTAKNGMITVEFTQGRTKVYRYRQDIAPYWFMN